MFRKMTIVTVLIVLVMAVLPTVGVMAKGNNGDLEKKWDQLVTNFNKQEQTHRTAHNIVENWLATHTNASTSERAEIERHLAVCNSALSNASAVISRHAGFDASGAVIDKALAVKSIKDLNKYLQQHVGSVKNLNSHVR